MTTLRVILDAMVTPSLRGSARYAEELSRALIATAPRGSDVAGVVSSSPESDYELIAERLPGLADLHKSALARRELRTAWQHGFTRISGKGMIHATSLLAPLYRHARSSDASEQIAVSVHDTVAWTHPGALTHREVSWRKAMLARAERYADAIVVPSHTVAGQVAELGDFGERIRVIGAAPSNRLLNADLPNTGASERRLTRLDLPGRFLLVVGDSTPHSGVDALVRALADVPDVALVVVGSDGALGDPVDLEEPAAETGLGDDRVCRLVDPDDGDLAVLFARAAAVVLPGIARGPGTTMIDAFAHGRPVVYSDDPAHVELAAGAGIEVPVGETDDERDGYPDRLADALRRVLTDPELAERVSTMGYDRARAFSWRDSAEKVWQLHADL